MSKLKELWDNIFEILQAAILFGVIAGVGLAIHYAVKLITPVSYPGWDDLVLIYGLKIVSIAIFLGDIYYFLNFFAARIRKGVSKVWA